MSLLAQQQTSRRRLWARPGGRHDRLVRLLKAALPAAVGALLGLLAVSPFTNATEVSFVLDKNKVDVAGERLRVTEAMYRGQDSKGQPFSLRAGSAVQLTSQRPVVQLDELEARLLTRDGPAVLSARRGAYDMDSETIDISGPIQFNSATGYRLTTRDVAIDIRQRSLLSAGAVDGRMPIGTFSADQISADLDARTVTLRGNARLRIEQGGLRNGS